MCRQGRPRRRHDALLAVMQLHGGWVLLASCEGGKEDDGAWLQRSKAACVARAGQAWCAVFLQTLNSIRLHRLAAACIVSV